MGKALYLLFVCKSTGHTHFSNDEIHISCEPERPTLIFFSCRMPEKLTMKGRLDVCCESPHPLFGLEKKAIFKPKLTSAEAYCRVFGPYFVYTGCIYHLEVAHVG